MRGNGAVMRLAKPKKKGILPLVFSRMLIIAVLMAMQVMLYVSLFAWMQHYLPHYAAIQVIFTACMALYLFNSSMDSSAKLTWLALIGVLPLLGAVLLAYTQTNLGHRATKKRTEELIAQSRESITQEKSVLERLKGDPYGTDDLCRYLCRSGSFPVSDGTFVTYFPQGEDKFAAMLEELEKAEKSLSSWSISSSKRASCGGASSTCSPARRSRA